jgi:hypothetical protein
MRGALILFVRRDENLVADKNYFFPGFKFHGSFILL